MDDISVSSSKRKSLCNNPVMFNSKYTTMRLVYNVAEMWLVEVCVLMKKRVRVNVGFVIGWLCFTAYKPLNVI